ncbi:hypothetical protein FACS18948_1470 [Clostridia bacterium]|nr:hypothetical protein FACS18948_1470 [Clostridia bacterium]
MKRSTLSYPGEKWALRITLNPEAAQGELLQIDASDQTFLTLTSAENHVEARLIARLEPNPLFPGKDHMEFLLTTELIPKSLSIEWHEFSVRLYADGTLADEDWPLGYLPREDWTIEWADEACGYVICLPDELLSDRTSQFTGPMQYFTWPGHNTGVGDCMPFSRDGRYCLYYLFDRRGHRSKGGLGAHQWAQISSDDLRNWTLHPMAVPITQQWEGSICTGSLIQKDGETYAFYAARMSDGSPARLTWAVSKDGVHFKKSEQYFALTAPYEPVSARDPMVFLGANGQYHMLVTTSLADGGAYGGCLAHLVSADLTGWTQLEPLIVPGYADQPECSDYFEWNGWYYLVFSNFAVARYHMSREPFGPWIAPASDILDTVEDQVVKTAAFKDRRLMTGFLARYPRTYAGHAVTHELYQRADGTLGVKFVPEILPAFADKLPVNDIHVENTEGRSAVELASDINGFRLRANLRLIGEAAIGGISLMQNENEYQVNFDPSDDRIDREHRIDFNPAARLISITRPDQYFRMGDPRLQITGIDMSDMFNIDLIIYRDILDMVLSNGRAMTMRLSDDLSSGLTLRMYAQNGTLSLTNITLEPIKLNVN